MKTANNPENKARFFAQYWGQKVIMHPVLFKPITMYDVITNPDNGFERDIEKCWLELNSLSNITNEDLIKCYHLYSEICAYDYTMDFASVIDMARHVIKMEGYNWLTKYTKISDYLRSKGYALPYMQLSIKDLIDYGWIKIKL